MNKMLAFRISVAALLLIIKARTSQCIVQPPLDKHCQSLPESTPGDYRISCTCKANETLQFNAENLELLPSETTVLQVDNCTGRVVFYTEGLEQLFILHTLVFKTVGEVEVQEKGLEFFHSEHLVINEVGNFTLHPNSIVLVENSTAFVSIVNSTLRLILPSSSIDEQAEELQFATAAKTSLICTCDNTTVSGDKANADAIFKRSVMCVDKDQNVVGMVSSGARTMYFPALTSLAFAVFGQLLLSRSGMLFVL